MPIACGGFGLSVLVRRGVCGVSGGGSRKMGWVLVGVPVSQCSLRAKPLPFGFLHGDVFSDRYKS